MGVFFRNCKMGVYKSKIFSIFLRKNLEKRRFISIFVENLHHTYNLILSHTHRTITALLLDNYRTIRYLHFSYLLANLYKSNFLIQN